MSPPSPILYADLYGKRRHVAKVQVLEREIGLLQDEIKSLADLEPALKSCKELHDYVEATPDPLVAINQTPGKSGNFWKNLWRKIGWMLRCCCCCNTKVCCSCFPCAKDSCWGCQKKTCTSACCSCSACNCSYNPACMKCSATCCCKSCSCF